MTDRLSQAVEAACLPVGLSVSEKVEETMIRMIATCRSRINAFKAS